MKANEVIARLRIISILWKILFNIKLEFCTFRLTGYICFCINSQSQKSFTCSSPSRSSPQPRWRYWWNMVFLSLDLSFLWIRPLRLKTSGQAFVNYSFLTAEGIKWIIDSYRLEGFHSRASFAFTVYVQISLCPPFGASSSNSKRNCVSNLILRVFMY